MCEYTYTCVMRVHEIFRYERGQGETIIFDFDR